MRIYAQGFEGGTHLADGLRRDGDIDYDTSPVNSDFRGNGGTYCVRRDLIGTTQVLVPYESFQEMMGINIAPLEFWMKYSLQTDSTGQYTHFRFSDNDFNSAIAYRHDDLTFDLYSGNYTTLEDSAAITSGFMEDHWIDVYLHIFMDATNGFVDFYLNDVNTPTFSFTGDTVNGTIPGLQRIEFGPGRYMDDFFINTPTMLYDTGIGGVPVAGNTITGGTSGATAVITGYDGDATSGRLFLHTVSGTFVDGETITDTGTFSAAVNAPTAAFAGGLEPNSGRPQDGFIIRFAPNADSSAGLTGTDGDSTNNYLLVDNIPISDNTDFVYGATDGDEDKYDIQSVGDVGLNSGDIDQIQSVNVVSLASKGGTTINTIQLSVTSGATTAYSEDKILRTDHRARRDYSFGYNPDDNDSFDEADIANLKIGHKFNA